MRIETQIISLGFDGAIQRGPDLSPEAWADVLQRHKEAMVTELRAIFRKEIIATREKRTQIERAAHGTFWEDA